MQEAHKELLRSMKKGCESLLEKNGFVSFR